MNGDAPANPARRKWFAGANEPALDVHIASIIVRAHAARMPAVLREIEAFGHYDVVATEATKAVLLTEAVHERVLAERITELSDIPGAIGAVLVYHHVEPAHRLDEAVEAADAAPNEEVRDAAHPT